MKPKSIEITPEIEEAAKNATVSMQILMALLPDCMTGDLYGTAITCRRTGDTSPPLFYFVGNMEGHSQSVMEAITSIPTAREIKLRKAADLEIEAQQLREECR